MASVNHVCSVFIVVVSLATCIYGQVLPVTTESQSFACVNISQVEFCSEIGYELGSFPNWRGQFTPETANQELLNYRPLIMRVCSNAIVHMLCAVYAPFCSPDRPYIRLPPCRELCQYVRDGCEDDLNEFGFQWPPVLECDRYPDTATTKLSFCHSNLSELRIPSNIPTDPPPTTTMAPDSNTTTGMTTEPPTVIVTTGSPQVQSRCPQRLGIQGRLENRSYNFDGINNCGVPCSGVYFSSTERNVIAPAFILVAAIICVFFTLFTVATFLIDRHRFHYPERPIIFLSFCYLLISLSYIVGSISKIAGGETDSFSCSDEEFIDMQSHSYIFQKLPNSDTTYKSASCVILFVLVYYFQMASAIWWVVLTLTWFLAAALKWGEEAVERLWLLYHVIAWSIPAIQVILVLALQLVDGDQLAGLCYTGGSNPVGLGVFVFLPLTVYLFLGLVFLLIGFTSLVNIRREVQNDPMKSRKLGRLILRIGIYSLLYTIPNVILLVLYVYELAKSRDWELHYVRACGDNGDITSSPSCQGEQQPSFAAFLIRYIMLFTIGICSTSWILSSKTFAAWHRFFCSCGCNNGKAETPTKFVLPDKREGDLSVHSLHHPQTAV